MTGGGGPGRAKSECRALASLGVSCPLSGRCEEPPLPSYFLESSAGAGARGEPSGCWAAHTALTLVEALRLFTLFRAALERRGLSGEAVVAAALLHDAGKLNSWYVEKGHSFHNISSAAVALRVAGEVCSIKPLAAVIAQAVLLHHEYRMWESLSSSEYLIRDYYTLLSVKARTVKLHERSGKALEALRGLAGSALRLVAAGEEGERWAELAQSLVDKVKARQAYSLTPEEERELASAEHAPKSLPLYYVLQLADNRAARWREGVDWRAELLEAASKAGSPLELGSLVARMYGSRSRILLTAARSGTAWLSAGKPL